MSGISVDRVLVVTLGRTFSSTYFSYDLTIYNIARNTTNEKVRRKFQTKYQFNIKHWQNQLDIYNYDPNFLKIVIHIRIGMKIKSII